MRILYIAGIFSLAFSAYAETPGLNCTVTTEAQSCSDGSGGLKEVKEAIRQFQKVCSASQEQIPATANLAASCDKAGKGDALRDCNDKWDKEGRALREFGVKTTSEKKNLEKLFLTILAPMNCAGAEQNKSILSDLTKRYDLVLESLKAPREITKVKTDLFQKAVAQTLIAQKFPEPASPRRYLGTGNDEPRSPPAEANVASMGSVEIVTSYRLALEFNYPGPKDATILVGDQQVKVTAEFAKVLKLEGAGVLDDGRMVNANNGKSYMFVRIIDAPYGLGSYKRTPLDPFRSIAVDPKIIPLGSTVYIYEARGMPLPPAPDGTPLFHDGYFRAVDVGSMINGTHIDIYAGHLAEDYRHIRNYFDGKTVHFYVIK
jgi:3D (Asp-Asp-Asp) domain-containing protein